MKIFKKVVIVVAVLVVLIAGCGLMISSKTYMDRAIDIDTPAGPIYNILITPKESMNWSPWMQIAPDETTVTYEGHHAGEGATMIWESENSSLGSGTQVWTECVHNKHVITKLYFGDMDEPATATFVLDEFDGYTEVTWEFEMDYGPNPFMHYMTLFTESMMGSKYEQGLLNLKEYVESLHMEEEELDIELEGDILRHSLQHLQD